METIIKRIVAAAMAFFVQFQLLLPGADLSPKDLGIPAAKTYTEKQRLSSSVWDMEIFDGVLYIGAGDYSANTGPTPIWAYDTETETWSAAAVVEEETVCRFCRIGDALIAPGIDATGNSWKHGNYHTLSGGQWVSFQELPGAVHNFDVTHYGGRYFFALGTADGETSPVLTSADGKTDFQPIPFYKKGRSLLDGSCSYTRVYDFFCVGGSLYCLLYCYTDEGSEIPMFFRFEDGAFQYVNDAEQDAKYWKQIPVMGKAALGSVQYFTTGTLYKTTDFSDITAVELPDGGVVTDLYTYALGERQLLYALSNVKNEDGTYTATVYLLEETATAVASCTATAPALSFVRDGFCFYLGFGGSQTSSDTGKVVRLSVFDRLLDR